MGACTAALACFAPHASGQAARGNTALRLSREIENSKLIDISSDSDKLCFYFSKHVTPYTNWNDKWQDTSPVGAAEDALRVVQRGSGKTLYAKRLLGPGDRGGFFTGGDRLYIETLPVEGRDSNILQRMVIDLQSGKDQQRVEAVPKSGLHFSYWPLDGNRLLGEGRSFDTATTEVIVLAELPDYREVKRIPFSRESALTIARRDGTLVMPVNRKAFTYFYENDVVYGATADLSVTWTKKADPSVTIWNIAISPTADFVALYVSESQGMAKARTHTVQVLSGKDGSLVGTVPVDPLQALAISPGGKLLAAAQRDPQRGLVSGTQPTMQVFDVASGKKLSTVIVDEFKLSSGEMFPVTTLFTPDGKNLITSARSAKLWEVG